MANTAKQSAELPEKEREEEITLYLCQHVEIWSQSTSEFIVTHMPKLKIVELDSRLSFSEQIKTSGFSIVLCDAKSKEQVERGLKVVRELFARIKQKDLIVSLITPSNGNDAIDQLEKNNIIQVLSPGTTSKALKIKLELLFSKMKAAKIALKPIEDKDYLVRAADDKKKSGKVIQLKTENEGKSFEISTAEKTREWGRGGSGPELVSAPKDFVELDEELDEDFESHKKKIVEKEALLEKVDITEETDASGLGLPGMRRIVLISPRNDDLTFAAEISRRTGASFHYFHEANENLQSFLTRFPNTVVFWDIDHTEASDSQSHHSAENIGLILTRLIPPIQIFAIANENINRLPYIFNYQRHVFAHCLFRGGNPNSVGVYSKIVGKMMSQGPFDIAGYFGEGAKSQQITISQSSHRAAAVNATERFLNKCGLIPRLSVQASQAAGELILNAIHSAPVDASGKRYRKDLEQPANFRFSNREQITLSIFQNESFYAISVRDHFGSLKADQVLSHLQKNYAQESTQASSGLGLNTVLSTGFSVLVAVKPGELTEVSIFFPNAKTYRSFRRTFRFLSLISVDPKKDEN